VLTAQYEGGPGKGDARVIFKGTANGPQIATQLNFTISPPTFAGPNEIFSVVVELLDVNGSLAAFSNLANGQVALTIDNNPSSGSLAGNATINATDATASFTGMSINNVGFGYTLMASISTLSAVTSAIDIFNINEGGPGSGNAKSISLLTNHDNQSIGIWKGGTVGNETNWSIGSNWVGGISPNSLDLVYIEPNGNGHLPILTSNATVRTLNFNGAQKHLELGNNSLTITEKVERSTSQEFIKTNGSGGLIKNPVHVGSTFLFPVGNSSFNPVEITNNTQTDEWFSARVFDEVYEFGTWGPVLSEPRVKRTWDIGKQTPSANSNNGVDFLFKWNNGEESSPPPSTYALFHHDVNGNGWGEVVIGTPNANGTTLSFVGYKGGFSPFGIGDPNDPLPVELIYFKGDCEENGYNFKWATAAEVNSKHFILEHSKDLTHWQALSNLPASGFSSTEKTYVCPIAFSIHEYGPYFRIYQEDIDGNFEHFAPIHLQCKKGGNENIIVSPNPSRNEIKISGVINPLDWELFDNRGGKIKSGKLIPENGVCRINLDYLPTGLYLFSTSKGSTQLLIQD